MNKKLIAGTMGLMMTVTMAMPIYATDEKSATVDYSQGSSYTLRVPKNITLNSTQTEQDLVALTYVNARPDEKIRITVSGGLTTAADGKRIVELTRSGDSGTKVISYVTNINGAPVDADMVLAVYEGYNNTSPRPTDSNRGIIKFSAVEDSSGGGDVKAGTYTGTITFKAEAVTK